MNPFGEFLGLWVFVVTLCTVLPAAVWIDRHWL
jgi:hypothetical protein